MFVSQVLLQAGYALKLDYNNHGSTIRESNHQFYTSITSSWLSVVVMPITKTSLFKVGIGNNNWAGY